jgi:hypothetical protein
LIILPKQASTNQKLGDGVYATYREVGCTCPQSCALLGNGCYAQHGNVALHARRGTQSPVDGDMLLGWMESQIPPERLVRHHVSGDLFRDDQPDMPYIEALMEGHRRRSDLDGWLYTHGWRKLDARRLNSLRNLTVNASADTMDEALEAHRAGWPTTVVVDPDQACVYLKEADTRLVICPQQTHDVKCSDCQLCLKSERKAIVGFRMH